MKDLNYGIQRSFEESLLKLLIINFEMGQKFEGKLNRNRYFNNLQLKVLKLLNSMKKTKLYYKTNQNMETMNKNS